MPRPELFESYLSLPQEEREKVNASPKGKLFRAFAGLPAPEQRKFLTQLREKQLSARQPTILEKALRVGRGLAAGFIDPFLEAGRAISPTAPREPLRGTLEEIAYAKEQGYKTPFELSNEEAMQRYGGPAMNLGIMGALGTMRLPVPSAPSLLTALRKRIGGKKAPLVPPVSSTAPPPTEPIDPRSAARLAAQREAFQKTLPTTPEPSGVAQPSGIPMPPSPIQRPALPPATHPASRSAARQAIIERIMAERARKATAAAPVAEHIQQLRQTVSSQTPDPLIGVLKGIGYKAGDATQFAKEYPIGTIEERLQHVFRAEAQRLAPATPPPVKTEPPPATTERPIEPAVVPPKALSAVEQRMQSIFREANDATGLPTGKQFGSVETEMGPQSRAIGAAKSFRAQFEPLYPELRHLPDVGPKAIAEAIKKDKDNKLYTIIKNEVTTQLEKERSDPFAITQLPSDFEDFSRFVDELDAKSETTEVVKSQSLLPSDWKLVVGKTRTKEGHTAEAEVDWPLKRIVFSDKQHMNNPDIVNHEIGHVLIGTLPNNKYGPILDEYAVIKSADWVKKGYDPDWIVKNKFHHEEIAMDYGQYLSAPQSVSSELQALFGKYLPSPSHGKSAVSSSATQPKLFQTQATMPPEGLQAKAPQVEHGNLLAGFKTPEPEPPRLPLGGGAPRAVEDIQAATQAGVASPMIQPVLHTKALKEAVQAVTDFMADQGLRVDPNGPRINVQLMEYIANGQVRPMRLLEWFERRGLDFDEVFSQAGKETASESGRLLQIWSRAAQVLGKRRYNPASRVLGEKVQRMTDTLRIQTGSPDVIRQTIARIVGPKRANEIDTISETIGKLDRNDRLSINRFLASIANKSLSSKLFELYINGLISSPVALQAKAVGDLTQKSSMLAERKIASTIDPAIAVLSGRSRERFAGEASADFFGWASMFSEGFRRGMKAYSTEMLEENALDATRLPAIPGTLGRTIRIPGRLFNAITVTARTMAERGELAARAYRMAMSEKLTGEAFNRRVAELMEHPPASFLIAMEHAGKYATYTAPFGTLGKTFMRIREAHPFLKFLVPIVKIPVNIAKVTLEHTPLNFGRIMVMAKKGQLVGGEISDELAKPLLGTMMLGGFALAAHHGLVTGHGPINPKEKALKEATGWRPDSVVVGGNYYPLRKLGVLGNLLSIAADMVDAAERGDEKRAERLALTAVMSISRVVSDPPFVRGVKNFADFVHEPFRYGEYWLKTFESSFVPSVVGRAASAIDPVKRETTLATAPLARIPFVSRQLPPVRTPFGEEATYGADTPIGRFAGLIPRSSVKPGTEVEAELVRLGMGVGRPGKHLSLGLKGELAVGERRISRNKEEQAFFETTAGRIAKETIRQVMETEGYRQAPDAVQRAVIHSIITRVRLGASRQIVPQALQELRPLPDTRNERHP